MPTKGAFLFAPGNHFFASNNFPVSQLQHNTTAQVFRDSMARVPAVTDGEFAKSQESQQARLPSSTFRWPFRWPNGF